MTEYAWTDVRDHAVTRFGGQTPGAELEQRVIDAFRHDPARVAEAVGRIAAKFRAGIVRSPWAVLALDVEQASAAADVRAVDTGGAARAELRAEQWLRAAGVHFDCWSEVRDELFGDRGSLRAYDSQALRDRFEGLWRRERPRGEACEREELDRAAKQVADRKAALGQSASPKHEPLSVEEVPA